MTTFSPSLPTAYRRLFCVNFRKSLMLPLASMPLSTDFVNAVRGDPCPLLWRTDGVTEASASGEWRVNAASDTPGAGVERMIGGYVPCATWDAVLSAWDGAVGFSFRHGEDAVRILFERTDGRVSLCMENGDTTERVPAERIPTDCAPGCRVIVTCRAACFDCYFDTGNGYAAHIHTFTAAGWEGLRRQDFIRDVTVGCVVRGCATLTAVRGYMDSGVRQADIRPIRYEDGSLMITEGVLYLTMSVRMEEGSYTGVFSWVPGTMRFDLVGALFFDTGDGIVSPDVASSILFDRPSGQWYLWVCAFSHGHILAHAAMDGDPRFGVSMIDVTLTEPMRPGDDDTVLRGKAGDEDPNFLYDARTGRWLLTVCRLVQTESGMKYRYHLFASERPFDGYTFVTRSEAGDETGGSMIPRPDGIYFACGSSFSERARYHLYRLPALRDPALLTFDHDDGGFRGWGTLLPVRRGTREIVYHLTFDRERGSGYNWSYGNLYCFEGIQTSFS